MCAEEGFEAAALVGVNEPEENDRILSHVGVDVEEDVTTERTEAERGGCGHGDPIAHPTHVHQHLAVGQSSNERSPE